MEKRTATYGDLGDKKAVIEMAAASGLPLVPQEKRNPLYTTSFGTGEMILDALNRGFNDVSVAIGGSATNDGGMGCARALGARFLDARGNELQGRGANLEAVESIDLSGLDPLLKEAKITVLCDVTNPLCGENGATYTFSQQKGASAEIKEKLEQGMCHYRDVIIRQFGTNPDEIPGSGAAGGLGCALTVFLGGEIRSGANCVLDLIGFDELLTDANLVVTGEGRTDWQSCFGKTVQAVGERAKAAGVPAVALSGSLGPGAAEICEHGIKAVATTLEEPMSLNEAMSRAKELYYKSAVRMFRMIKVGMELSSEK
jgi:glycerate kinase